MYLFVMVVGCTLVMSSGLGRKSRVGKATGSQRPCPNKLLHNKVPISSVLVKWEHGRMHAVCAAVLQNSTGAMTCSRVLPPNGWISKPFWNGSQAGGNKVALAQLLREWPPKRLCQWPCLGTAYAVG